MHTVALRMETISLTNKWDQHPAHHNKKQKVPFGLFVSFLPVFISTFAVVVTTMWEVLLDDPAAQHNIVAWLITSFVCLAWLKLSEAIVSYGILDSTTSRKVVCI